MHWNFYCLYQLLSCGCDKTLWPKEHKEHLFVLAVPEGEETIMVGKHGRRQQARQPKGSESSQLQMQAQSKISKLAVVKGFNIKVRFQELTCSTQLQLLNLLKEHPHVRIKYSNDQEYRGYFSLKPCYYFVYRSCSGLQQIRVLHYFSKQLNDIEYLLC